MSVDTSVRLDWSLEQILRSRQIKRVFDVFDAEWEQTTSKSPRSHSRAYSMEAQNTFKTHRRSTKLVPNTQSGQDLTQC